MSEHDTLERRIRRLEDRAEIRELIARYCITVDDRDIDALAQCFTADGVFRSRNGLFDASGREAVVEQYRRVFSILGPCNHFTHDHIIRFAESDPDQAFGLVTSHAELVRNGEPMWTAQRYEDIYRRENGRWRFAERLVTFMYFLKVSDYAHALPGDRRMHAYDEPATADYPEQLDSWKRYYGK